MKCLVNVQQINFPLGTIKYLSGRDRREETLGGKEERIDILYVCLVCWLDVVYPVFDHGKTPLHSSLNSYL